MLAQLPLRTRLVVGFCATMLLVLTAAGAFVYWRVSFALDRQVNEDLSEVSGRLIGAVDPAGQLAAGTQLYSSEAYQVLDSEGRVLTHSDSVSAPLLDPVVAKAALSAPIRIDIGKFLPISRHPLRAYAIPIPHSQPQRAAILVVAVRRDHRDEALRELLAQLSLAGFGALLVTGIVGERLARLALRPVERYRAQAADIVKGAKGVRLDVPVGRNDEVTRLGDTLNAMIDALEEALDRERRFVNDASHELRTPLTLLKTRVQLAQRRKRTVPEHEVVLTEVETDIGRLAQLAGQLLQVGTTTAVGGSMSSDLAAAAIEEVERRRPMFGASDLALQLRTPSPVPVALDPTQLAQLLGNLLDNAAVHGRPPVTIVVDVLDGVGCLQVIDLGEGMDRELLPIATRRFARAPKAQSRPGFGLGLFLVHDIINCAGGELRLCCAGAHERLGRRHPTLCQHVDAMTVTVLLPMVAGGRRPETPARMSSSEQPSNGNHPICGQQGWPP